MNNQIYEEATEWLLQHRDGELSPKEKEQFDNWLRASPQHVRAYLEMSAIYEGLPALGADWNPNPDQLIARARDEDNIRPLPGTARAIGTTAVVQHAFGVQPDSAYRRERVGVVALAAVLLLTILGGATWYALERNTYSTDIGEQRSIVLADGSTFDLNSRSRIRIRYTPARRDVELLEGQALFRVAHDPARPFVVHSGATRILAVGTQFDVYEKPAVTVVTVVEGKVEVLPRVSRAPGPSVPGAIPPGRAAASNSGSAIFLVTGEQLTIPIGRSTPATTASVHDSPQPVNVAAATAWTQHNLVFEASPLTEVAAEFNRYNRHPLVIVDSEIANIRISGMFSSADQELFLKFLRAQAELTVEDTDREIRIGKR